MNIFKSKLLWLAPIAAILLLVIWFCCKVEFIV